MKPIKSSLPTTSLLKNTAYDYLDSYSVALDTNNLNVEKVGKSFFTSGPAWVGWLFALRNKIVSLIGLKTSGSSEAEHETVLKNFKGEIGQRVGLFKVFDGNENEIIFGEDDKHLDFRVSLLFDKKENLLHVSTTVKIHNWLGKLYFLPVKPFHKLIVPNMMKGMVNQLTK
jgi:hypothetical protein